MVDKINKKGDYKYGIILSLILGVMVLSLSLYFIFQELWSEDELDWEICRQSIQVRALLPEPGKFGFKVSFKDDYPLKCKTQVVNIEKKDIENIKDAQKVIAETMARCWALYDKGDSNSFPSDVYGGSVTCVPCARIHLTEDAKKELEKRGLKEINIRDSLNLKMTKDYSYFEYLNNSGKKFAAFNPAFSREFDFSENEFRIDIKDKDAAVFKNRLTGGVDEQIPFGIEFLSFRGINKVYLPKIFDITSGDLLINYGIITTSRKTEIGDYIPYLFYFQVGQKNSKPFEEVKKIFIDGLGKRNGNFCEKWEGIPA